MKLRSPFFISSRLLPAISIAGAIIQLDYARRPDDSRTRYRWVIDIAGPDGKESSFSGDDLQSGNGGGDLMEGFQSLFSFLGAAGESFNYSERMGRDGMDGENATLFPRTVTEWAAQNLDKIGLMELELKESNGIEE